MPWQLDPNHTEVGFEVRHMMVSKVRGRFTDVAAEVHLDEAQPANSRVEATIGTASVTTGALDRAHRLGVLVGVARKGGDARVARRRPRGEARGEIAGRLARAPDSSASVGVGIAGRLQSAAPRARAAPRGLTRLREPP